jgi:hypothetical protein
MSLLTAVIIEVNPGQTATCPLPTMTPGMIVINATNATAPQGRPAPSDVGGHPAGLRRHREIPRLKRELLALSRYSTTSARGQRRRM